MVVFTRLVVRLFGMACLSLVLRINVMLQCFDLRLVTVVSNVTLLDVYVVLR